MSVDKLVDSGQLDSDLTSVANAIRAKSGGSSQLAFPSEFVSEIQSIVAGGGLTLLKSGTFTKSSGTYLNIPVSYTGTPVYVFVAEQTVADATDQVMGCVRCLASIGSDMATDFGNRMKNGSIKGYAVAYCKNASNSVSIQAPMPNSSNLGQWVVDNTKIYFGKPGNYTWRNTGYDWYIYGEAAT